MKIRKSTTLIYLVIIWGILVQLLPTSTSPNDINAGWISLYVRIGLVLCVAFILFAKKYAIKRIYGQTANMALLFLFSILTLQLKPFTEAYYNMYYYLILALVISMDLTSFKINKFVNVLFYVMCILFCLAGILVVMKYQPMCDFLSNYYTRHWVKSTYYMTLSGKPVGSYATHSIAGFMYFQFILILYYKNKARFSWINMGLMGCLAFLIVMLRSNTAIMLVGLSVVLLLIERRGSSSLRRLIFKIGVVITITIFIMINIESIGTIVGNSENGLLGRFTGTSNFLTNIEFLKNNLLPIGWTTSSSLWLSDSGYIIVLIRGGLLSLLLIYGGVYMCVKKNMLNKAAIYPMLISLAVFEIGYPILLEIKYMLFIPVLIVFLNSAYRDATDVEMSLR